MDRASEPPGSRITTSSLKCNRPLADAAFNGSSIQSAVSAGVVKLYGNVRTNDEKILAEAKITNLRGVKSINDLLTVIDRTPRTRRGQRACFRRSQDCDPTTGNNHPHPAYRRNRHQNRRCGRLIHRHNSRQCKQRGSRRHSDRNASDRKGYRSQSSRSSQWSRPAKHRAS